MEDGRSGILGFESVATRLQALRDYQYSWETLVPRRTMTLPLESDRCIYELYGNVFASVNKASELTVTALPSIVRKIKMLTYKLPLGMEIMDFGMDPEQDLLVLLEPLVR